MLERTALWGGSIVSLHLLATALSSHHQVTLGVFGEPPFASRFRESGIPTVRVSGRPLQPGGALDRGSPFRRAWIVRVVVGTVRPLAESLPLERLARDPELRHRLGGAGREEAARRFSTGEHVAAVEAVYALALDRR